MVSISAHTFNTRDTDLSFGFPVIILAIVLHTLLESHLRYKELTIARIFPNFLKIILVLILSYFWQIVGICIALVIYSWLAFVFYNFLALKEEMIIAFIDKYPRLKKLIRKY